MGLLADLSGWQLLGITLVLTHITIASVTIYLHRCQSHRAVELGAIATHFFRFWLWLTTGTVTREWVAIHRKHHAKCETEDDPHSPQVKGIHRVLWGGAFLYRKECANQETLQRYGKGTPDDWLERTIYTPYSWVGIVLMLVINSILFGWAGLLIWVVQMLWIPFWAAGVINGIGHFWGYRNWCTTDESRNLFPIGILIGGEELHNNHHAFAVSARLSSKWYEFDIGWMYIRLLCFFKMAKVLQVSPRIQIRNKSEVDLDTESAVASNRLQVLSNFTRQVMSPILNAELKRSQRLDQHQSNYIKQLLAGQQPWDEKAHDFMQKIMPEHQVLQTVYQYQQRLQDLWGRSCANRELRLAALQEWINTAEKTGIKALEEFAYRLRGYSMA